MGNGKYKLHRLHIWKVTYIELVPIETMAGIVLFLPETMPTLKVRYRAVCTAKVSLGSCNSTTEGSIMVDWKTPLAKKVTEIINARVSYGV